MIFLYVLLTTFGTIYGIGTAISTAVYGVSWRKAAILSPPSRNLLAKYRSLPKDSRPVPKFYRVLRELEGRFERNKVRKHFAGSNWDGGYRVNWNVCGQYRQQSCDYKPFHSLNDSIGRVIIEVEANKQRVHNLGISQGNDVALELSERLKTEANLLRETRELL